MPRLAPVTSTTLPSREPIGAGSHTRWRVAVAGDRTRRGRRLTRMAVGGPQAPPALPGASDRRSGLVLGALLLVPFVALLVWTLANHMWAVGDVGLTEVAV